jgi:hypothetical protein
MTVHMPAKYGHNSMSQTQDSEEDGGVKGHSGERSLQCRTFQEMIEQNMWDNQ